MSTEGTLQQSTMSSSSSAVSPSGFVVLGVGLPRTGTTSLCRALVRLLDGPCYHMDAVWEASQAGDRTHAEFWRKASKGQARKKDWEEFLSAGGYRSGVDFPVALYWRDLLRYFPHLKFILSTRKPDTWYRSVKNSILHITEAFASFPLSWCLGLFGFRDLGEVAIGAAYAVPDGMSNSMFGSVEAGEEAAVEFFKEWEVQIIKAGIPADRLLVHEPKDGYGPICEFLGVPDPGEPYPRSNDTQEYRSIVRRLNAAAYAVVLGAPILMGGLFYYYFASTFFG